MSTETIGLGLIVAATSALFTYFIKSLSEPKGTKELRGKIVILEAKVSALEKGQVFIITKLGGNPKDMGLL